jgi:hypothetical protein
MESLEHWGLFLSNQVDKKYFYRDHSLWEILHGRTFNTKTNPGLIILLKKNINMAFSL